MGPRPSSKLLDDLTQPIAAIVIINNLANIVGSIIIGKLAADTFGSQWLGVFSAGLTLAIIVCSEIIPKTFGRATLRDSGPYYGSTGSESGLSTWPRDLAGRLSHHAIYQG